MTTQLRLRVVDKFEEFRGLREPWNAAVAGSLDPNVFLTHEWLSTWWQHFGAGAELHVVIVTDEDGIVALAPLSIARVGVGPISCTAFRPISHDAGDYGGIALVRREGEAIELLCDHLRAEIVSRRGVLTLPRVPDDGVLMGLLRSPGTTLGSLAVAETVLSGAVWYADLQDGVDLDARAKEHRIAKKLRRLRAHHDVKFTSYAADDLHGALAQFLDLYRLRWAGDESLQGLLAGPELERFLLDALGELNREGWVRVAILSADGQPIAVLYLEFNSCLHRFKSAFDPQFAELLSWPVGDLLLLRGVPEEGDQHPRLHARRPRLQAAMEQPPTEPGLVDRVEIRVPGSRGSRAIPDRSSPRTSRDAPQRQAASAFPMSELR